MKNLSRHLFKRLWLGWLWLALIALHIAFFSQNPPEFLLLKIFDQLMIASSFLVYIIHGMKWDRIWFGLPFLISFFFWGYTGVLAGGIYRHLTRKTSFSSKN